MITWKPNKYKFSPELPSYFREGTYIEIKNIWGKVICRLQKDGHIIKIKDHSYIGPFEYLKISRGASPLVDSFKIQLFCRECGDAIYVLTVKLPLLIKIKTDFYVTKDTNRG